MNTKITEYRSFSEEMFELIEEEDPVPDELLMSIITG